MKGYLSVPTLVHPTVHVPTDNNCYSNITNYHFISDR